MCSAEQRSPHGKRIGHQRGPFRLSAVCDTVIVGGTLECQRLRVQRNPRSRRFHSKNESSDEPTNYTSSGVINRARSWTIGSKPKRRFFGLGRTASTQVELFTSRVLVNSG